MKATRRGSPVEPGGEQAESKGESPARRAGFNISAEGRRETEMRKSIKTR